MEGILAEYLESLSLVRATLLPQTPSRSLSMSSTFTPFLLRKFEKVLEKEIDFERVDVVNSFNHFLASNKGHGARIAFKVVCASFFKEIPYVDGHLLDIFILCHLF